MIYSTRIALISAAIMAALVGLGYYISHHQADPETMILISKIMIGAAFYALIYMFVWAFTMLPKR